MAHGLPQGFNRPWCLAALKQSPVRNQFLLVQFSPSLNQTKLPSWERAGEQFDRVKAENRRSLFTVGMEMRCVVLRTSLHVHPDYYTEKTADFGHGNFLFDQERPCVFS
jgi:hypothetical protein